MKLTGANFLKIAMAQLYKKKGRSFLTMLGVIIGVMSVVLLVAIGNGLKFYIEDQFESLGSNKIYIIPGNPFKNGQFQGGASRVTTVRFDFKDVANLERVAGVKSVSPITFTSDSVYFSDQESFAQLVGSTTDIVSGQNVDLSQGRFFTKAEESRGAKVAVIGAKVNEELFDSQNALGKNIAVGNKKMKVVGVVEKKGGIGSGIGEDPDAIIYTPYKVVFGLTGEKDFYNLIIETEDERTVDLVKERVKKVLFKRYDEDDFTVADQTQILSMVSSILGTLTIALAGIASISLLVGGVGIMNIMFVSVTERIKEIGLRKAVGATPRDILFQFLLEAVVVSVIGGVIGVVLSWGITSLINRFFPAVITLWSVLLAFGVSAFIGIVFGVAPARSAAKLSPIEALRYE